MAYKKGDIIYDIGQPSETFYIIKEGQAVQETTIESETNLKYPKNTKSWEIQRQTKTMQYHIRDLSSTHYFGHEELLSNIKSRQSRVKCLTQCQILYINKDDFLEQFWPSTLKQLKERHSHIVDIDFIMGNINSYIIMKSKNSKAILDATKVNPVNLHGDRVISEQRAVNKQLDRLKPWMKMVKNNKTQNNKIMQELARVKVLETKQETITVYRSSLVSKERVLEFEEMMRPKQHFLNNQKFVENSPGLRSKKVTPREEPLSPERQSYEDNKKIRLGIKAPKRAQ